MSTVADFHAALRAGSTLLITDTATGDKIHLMSCPHVKQEGFELKVITNQGKHGRYFVLDDPENESRGMRRCQVCCG